MNASTDGRFCVCVCEPVSTPVNTSYCNIVSYTLIVPEDEIIRRRYTNTMHLHTFSRMGVFVSLFMLMVRCAALVHGALGQ